MFRRLMDALGVFGFGIAIVITNLIPFLVAKIGVCIVGKGKFCGFMYRTINIFWWLTLKLCCWVQVRHDGVRECRKGINASAGKPRIILINHVSFLDSLLVIGSLPFREIASTKTLAAAHLAKMPVIGAISMACGHLFVPFKSKALSDDMGVDKDKVAEVQQAMEVHVAAGNVGAWYPEGKLNLGDQSQLQTFRAGGFALPAKVDCEIWCIAHVGNGVCWPAKATLGGKPCRIKVKYFRLCESSKALADTMPAPPAGEDPLRARSIFLAQRAQAAMQSEIDAIVSEGWASVKRIGGDQANSLDALREPLQG